MPEPEYVQLWEDQIPLSAAKTAGFFVTKKFMPASTCLAGT